MVLDHHNSVGHVVQHLEIPLFLGVNDHWAEQTIRRLGTMMRVVPICAMLTLDVKSEGERRVWGDGTLSDANSAVHMVSTILEHAMEMNRRCIGSFIIDMNNDGISLIAFNQRARILVVYKHHWSVNTIWIERGIADGPGVFPYRWRRAYFP